VAAFWSTELSGSPEACRGAAADLAAMGRGIAAILRGLPVPPLPTAVWAGPAQSAAAAQLAQATHVLGTVGRRARELGAALDALAAALQEVGEQLVAARTAALSSGLVVGPAGFTADVLHPAARAVAAARSREEAAHRDLSAILLTVAEGSFGERLVKDVVTGITHLPDGTGALDEAAWLVGLPGAWGLLSERAQGAVAARSQSVVAAAVTSGRPMVVGGGVAATRAAPLARGAVRAAGPAGSVLTVVTSGRDQWQADADEPRYSTADRVGRATVRAGLEGGAVLAGGFVGGQYGAAIGSMVLPGAGTAVGAAVGAGIGAFVASEAGRATADAVVDAVDDVIDLANDGLDRVADAVDAAADAAADVGDTLCFWR
jgi:hypothetical protein